MSSSDHLVWCWGIGGTYLILVNALVEIDTNCMGSSSSLPTLTTSNCHFGYLGRGDALLRRLQRLPSPILSKSHRPQHIFEPIKPFASQSGCSFGGHGTMLCQTPKNHHKLGTDTGHYNLGDHSPAPGTTMEGYC